MGAGPVAPKTAAPLPLSGTGSGTRTGARAPATDDVGFIFQNYHSCPVLGGVGTGHTLPGEGGTVHSLRLSSLRNLIPAKCDETRARAPLREEGAGRRESAEGGDGVVSEGFPLFMLTTALRPG